MPLDNSVDPEVDPYTGQRFDGGDGLNLTASTGKNDPSSAWGGVLGAVNSLGTTAGTLYNTVTGKPKPKAASTTPAWLIPAAIGGALLLVVLLVIKK